MREQKMALPMKRSNRPRPRERTNCTFASDSDAMAVGMPSVRVDAMRSVAVALPVTRTEGRRRA